MPDVNQILENVFKVEKQMGKKTERKAKKRKVIMPTDSFFSEDFDSSVLLRPTFVHWDHAYESPIPENGAEMRDYQIDCVFNASECHVNLQDHLSHSWNNFNQKYENSWDVENQEAEINYDWLQLSRGEIQEYVGRP